MTKMQRLPPARVETCLFDLDDCLYRNPEFPRDMAINIQSEGLPLRSQHPTPSTSTQPAKAPSYHRAAYLNPWPCDADYMTEKLGFPSEGIAAACAELYSEFGTTLSGLVVRLLLAQCASRLCLDQNTAILARSVMRKFPGSFRRSVTPLACWLRGWLDS